MPAATPSERQRVLAALCLAFVLGFAPLHAAADPVRERTLAFFAAVDRADWTTIERLVATGFVAVDPRGGVSSRAEYLSEIKQVGEGYRRVLGKHFPAMALVQVAGLLEVNAKVEIQGLAVLPPPGENP